MNITSFDDLLFAARSQPEPQRLLFVFAGAELPGDATPQQRASFEAGEGGALVPLMTVDKAPDEIASFHTLLEESLTFSQEWRILFVAAMSGHNGNPPSSVDAERLLEGMVESIKQGAVGSFISLDRQGQAVALG
ncbi:MAG: ribonucleotide reductase subunit alpha [Ramlibacter sp.]|jgi:hypothetical protein